MRHPWLLPLTIGLVPVVAPAQEPSPYAGLEGREIKALSAEEIAALRSGEGAGFALTAELNGVPGPRHVLDLADELDLSPGQRSEVEAVFAAMRDEAVELGERLVAAERELDRFFADGRTDPDALAGRVAEAARLRGRLRAVHLVAHLATAGILAPAQTARYVELRGYAGGHPAGDEHRHAPR